MAVVAGGFRGRRRLVVVGGSRRWLPVLVIGCRWALTTPPSCFRRFVIGCATRHPVLLPVVRGSRHCNHETPEKKCLAPLPGATNRATSALSADLRALAAYAIRNRPYRARRVCFRRFLARWWLTLISDEAVVETSIYALSLAHIVYLRTKLTKVYTYY